MLTATQVDVLSAINDYCEIHDGRMNLGAGEQPLPDLLADLEIPDTEVFQAVGDLHELGLIKGVMTAQASHPVVVLGLTALGRQELP